MLLERFPYIFLTVSVYLLVCPEYVFVSVK